MTFLNSICIPLYTNLHFMKISWTFEEKNFCNSRAKIIEASIFLNWKTAHIKKANCFILRVFFCKNLSELAPCQTFLGMAISNCSNVLCNSCHKIVVWFFILFAIISEAAVVITTCCRLNFHNVLSGKLLNEQSISTYESRGFFWK